MSRRAALATALHRLLPRAGIGAGPEVSILIPSFEAEKFIDRTLRFARGQTHQACRILVSVDRGQDDTAGQVRRHAALDPRVELIEQQQRRGWAGNVNALLERVATPYCFLYMHDDIIVPQYTETLLQVLEANADAASAHGDMGHFGASDHLSSARSYGGGVAARLLTFFLAPERGSPLRSLLRSAAVADLRLPEDAPGGLWANEPFLARLIAAGPALAVAETLYLRWQLRPGGLTDGWRSMPPERAFEGCRRNLHTMAALVLERVEPGPLQQALLKALLLNQLPRLRQLEDEAGQPLFQTPSELHPAFTRLDTVTWDQDGLPDETAGWAERALADGRHDPRLDWRQQG